MSTFAEQFNRSAEHTVNSFGRVNLIGEHTDYNQGFVLPTPIPQSIQVQLAVRSDDEVRLVSDHAELGAFEYRLGNEAPTRRWGDYAQGITYCLRRRNLPTRGFEAFFSSSIPLGSGLSSSAAFGVALLKGLRSAFLLDLSDLDVAKLVQESENYFVGARVGLLDPMAISLGTAGFALFIDMRSLHCESLPLHPEKMELVVLHSGISHRNTSGEYNRRRAECEAACKLLSIQSLRDATDTEDFLSPLPSVLLKRATHVIRENNRVLRAVEALREEDPQTLGKLFRESHESLRDDYQVSIPEIDSLVEILCDHQDVFGARMTGGGFGGSVVALARPGRARDAASTCAEIYQARTGNTPSILLPT